MKPAVRRQQQQARSLAGKAGFQPRTHQRGANGGEKRRARSDIRPAPAPPGAGRFFAPPPPRPPVWLTIRQQFARPAKNEQAAGASGSGQSRESACIDVIVAHQRRMQGRTSHCSVALDSCGPHWPPKRWALCCPFRPHRRPPPRAPSGGALDALVCLRPSGRPASQPASQSVGPTERTGNSYIVGTAITRTKLEGQDLLSTICFAWGPLALALTGFAVGLRQAVRQAATWQRHSCLSLSPSRVCCLHFEWVPPKPLALLEHFAPICTPR